MQQRGDKWPLLHEVTVAPLIIGVRPSTRGKE